MSGQTNRKLWVISTMVGLTFLGTTMLVPLTPLLALKLGAGPMGVGFIVSAAFILPLFCAMPIGALVDSRGTRGMLLWGCFMTGVGPMAVALAPSFLTLLAAQLIVGMGHLMVIVAAQTFVGNLGGGRAGESNFAWYSTFISAGGLIGPILGGLIYDFGGFQAAFAVAGGVSLFAILASGLLGPRRGTRTTLAGLAPFGHPGQVRRLLGNDAVRVAMVVSCGVLFAMGSYGAFLPVYLDSLAVPATLIGILVSMRSAASMVIRPFMAQIIRVLGGRCGTFLVATGVVGLGVFFTGFTEHLPILFLLVFAVGAGVGVTQPISMVTVADHVEKKERGFALGLRLTGNRAMQLLSPLVLGIAAEFFGFRATFLVGGIGLLATMILIARWGPAAEMEEPTFDPEKPSPPPGPE